MNQHLRDRNSVPFGPALLVLAAMSCLPANAEDPPIYQRSFNEAHSSALNLPLPLEEDGDLLIVPISRIQANFFDEQVPDPLPHDQMSNLLDYINLVTERGPGHRQACSISPADWGHSTQPTDPKAPDAYDLREVIPLRQIVVLGPIEHITTAWDFQYETVISVVYLRLEEVLADKSRTLAAGDLVPFIRQWGEATLLGQEFCTNPPAQVSAKNAPGIGDYLVVTGIDDLRNPPLLLTNHEWIYPVVDGVVYPPVGDTTPPGYSDDTATLAELRSLFQ